MCPNCEKKLSIKKMLTIVFVFAISIVGMRTVSAAPHQHTKKSLSDELKAQLKTVFEANEKLHEAYLNYDAKEVGKNAKQLNASIEKISDPEVAKLLKFSKDKLNDIDASKERESNNQNYHLVSMALIHILNTYDMGDQYQAYSCPMVKKKWIQNTSKSDKVHNPYAPNMPNCGEKLK